MEEIDIEICLIKVNKNCKNIYIYKKNYCEAKKLSL